MPYSISLPDGRIISDIPDEVPPQAAKARIQQAFPELAQTGPVDKPAAPGERSMVDSAKDAWLNFVGTGEIGSVRGVASAFGAAGTPLDKFLTDAQTHILSKRSEATKEKEREAARILEEAKDKGALDQAKAGLQAFMVDPTMNIAGAAGYVPLAFATSPVRAAALISGAVQGAGAVKTAMYDAVKEELGKTNLPPEEVEKRALAAQDYFGENPGMILAGAGLGALGGITGVNAAITSIIRRRVIQSVGREELEAIAKQGLAKTVAKGAVGEAPLEFIQGGQEQAASNVALQGAGVDTPTMRGVISQGTLEGITGAALGGGFGPIERAQARNILNQRDAAKLDQEELKAAPPAGSTEEKVLAIAAQLQARGMDEEAAIMTAAQLVREQMAAEAAEKEKAQAKEAKLQEKEGQKAVIDKNKAANKGEAPFEVFDTYEAASTHLALLRKARPKDNLGIVETDDGKFGVYLFPKQAEAPSATPTVTDTTGAGATLPSAGATAGVPTGGDTAPVTTGLDTAGATTQQPDVGAAVQPPALDTVEALTARQEALRNEIDVVLEQAKALQDDVGRIPPANTEERKQYDALIDQFNTLGGEKLGVDEQLNQLKTPEVTPAPEAVAAPEPVATTTEEPSVAETPEAKQAEEKRTEAPAEVSDTPVDADTKAATDNLKEATTAVDAAVQAREEDKATREKGKAEKPNLRKAQKEADTKLETAILGGKGTGETGMLNTLKELQLRIAGAEKILRINAARTADPTKAETTAVDLKPIEDSLLQNRASLELGLLNLYEFASNPKYEGRPSHTKALEFLTALDEPTKDKLLERSKRRLAAEEGLGTRTAPRTVEQSLQDQKEDRAANRTEKQIAAAEKKMDEEALARAEGTFTETEKAAPAVTVKKKRVVVIPPKVGPSATSASRKGKKSLAASYETDTNITSFSSDKKKGGKPQSVTKVLQYIQVTGNAFESALATRLLARDNISSVKNTLFYVLEPEDTQLLDSLRKGEDGLSLDTAIGLYDLSYDPSTGVVFDSIFVRGPGFGEGDNGTNNVTVLHEALHATVNKRIIYAKAAREFNLPISPELEEAYNALDDLYNRSRDAMEAYLIGLRDNGKPTPEPIKALIAGDAFSDVTEFVTYGMTDPDMQEFLRNRVSGTVTRTNGFTDFVSTILKLLGLDEKHVSGLRDLIEYTDRIAASVNVSPREASKYLDYLQAAEATADLNYTHNASKKAGKKAADIQERLKRHAASDSAAKIVEDLGDLSKVAKNPELWGQWLSVQYKNMNVDGLNALLALLPTNIVTEMGVNNGIVSLKDVETGIRKMTTARIKSQMNVQEIADPWIKLPPAMQKRLSQVLLYATDARIDPDKTKGKDVVLDRMWNQLDPEAKKIYRKVRDFYADNYALYRSLLNKAVEDSDAEGTVDDINTPKGRLAAAIKATYEVGASIEPYFPLMRFGEYWVSFGKGAKREFHMFESAGLRDAFAAQRLKELGEKRSFDQMVEDLDADFGNEQRTLQERLGDDSPALKSVISLIDSTDFGDPEAKAFIKDKVYQMHLLMLPDASIRKQFIQRKGTAGFSNDALRAFIASGTRLSNQLSRVRYGGAINNALSNAKESLKGNPDKGKLAAIVKEIELRAKDELNPPTSDSFMDMVARRSNKLGFIYLLSGAKSILNQMFSIVNFTLPTLGTRHGWGRTLAEFSKYAALGYGQIGMYDKQGNWHAPSLGLSARVQSNKEERAAFKIMQELGVSNFTQTYDLALRRGVPSAQADNAFDKTIAFMGAGFHAADRLTREICFMTSFRLTYERTKNFDKAIEQAVADTNESLFDYSSWNKPRAMRPAPIRAAAQFKQFPMYVTLYLWRNFYKMASLNSTLKERSEGAQMFLGTLGMTALMAGMSGLPYIIESTILAAVQGLLNATRDEFDEEPLEENNFKLWFYNVFLPETFGETKIMGMRLSELIASGALNTATGYDIASGVSLNNLWFHDGPAATNWTEALDNTVTNMFGPGYSVVRGFVSGVDDMNKGDYVKGIEKFLPAFFRGAATAYRYSEEGALTANKAVIKDKDEFTATQLMMQMLGFRTTGLAQVMNNNFAVQQMVKKIKGERSGLLKQLDNAIETGSDSRIDEVMEKIDTFSGKYPAYTITDAELYESMQAREKVRQQTVRGLYLDEKSAELDVLLDRATRNLEEEAAR